MYQHLSRRSPRRKGDLSYGPYGPDLGSEHSFLPNLQALMDRLENIFRRYAVPHAQALRARFSTDPDSLQDCDILQILLDPVSGGRNTKPVAEALLRKFRTFGQVIKAPARELMTIKGVDEFGAAALKTVETAAMHLLRHAAFDEPILATSDSVKNYLIAKLQHERTEVFCVLYLNSCGRLIEYQEVWRGTVDQVPVYPREVMRRCLELDATEIMIAHNHPSGSLEPSCEDIQIAEDIVETASWFDITLLDSLIIGGGQTFSMRDRGLFSTTSRAAKPPNA
jgi:DNA repair protein RadC